MADDDSLLVKATSGTRAVEDITFHIAGKRYTFEPDMASPADMPYLLQLMLALAVQPHVGAFDGESFVNEHNLWHCFKERA